MEDLYYRFKTVDQVAIPITIRLELLCLVLEEIKDRTGGVAILEGLRRGMCSVLRSVSPRASSKG
jgi:hypothetical protein